MMAALSNSSQTFLFPDVLVIDLILYRNELQQKLIANLIAQLFATVWSALPLNIPFSYPV